MKFTDFALSAPILQAIEEQDYTSPTPVQIESIAPILAGKDVIAAAKTGTGKTAAFTLPLIERLSKGKLAASNQARALILTPTRELANQVADNVATYACHTHLRSVVVFGGVKINPQMMKLRKGADILIATPGRLLDLYQQNAIKFNRLETFILDEADRMLDMGFIRDIKKIAALLPTKKQTLMFSATFSSSIKKFAKNLMHHPVEIALNPDNQTVNAVKQYLYTVDKKKKSNLLFNLIVDKKWRQVLVFTRTKHGANRLTRFLCERGLHAAAIHGNKSQSARTKTLAQFKSGKLDILVATDIAARGLDIDLLPQVVNFDLPNVPEDYVHRIGRTGRAGALGEAVSLVSADEADALRSIEYLIKQSITRHVYDDFEPTHDVPETNWQSHKTNHKRSKKIKIEHHDGQRSTEVAKGHRPPEKNTRHRRRSNRDGSK